MNEKRLRKNVANLKLILEKNAHKILRLLVSYNFMKGLQQVADLIDLTNQRVTDTKQHSFDEIHATYTEENEIWYLWGIPLTFSNSMLNNAIIEMSDKTTVVVEGISEYKNK